MASDNYNHPSFITRQMDNLGKTTAGANGTSLVTSYPTAVRIHRMSAAVVTAGTSAGALLNLLAYNGTTTTTLMAAGATLGSSAANTVVVSTDCNTQVPAGSVVFLTNGTDATAVASVTLELTLDPVAASW